MQYIVLLSWSMAARFINLDRQTPMLLPCDLRDWVPAGHIVHFILESIEQLPTATFHVNHRGSGSAQGERGGVVQLALTAARRADSPTAPAPKMAIEVPASGASELSTAPAPV
jgi:hypothetical protein